MSRVHIYIIFTFMWIGRMNGQGNVSFFTLVSYNSFMMSDLRNEQEELQGEMALSNIPAKIVESFPPFYGFKGGFLISMQKGDTNTFSVGGVGEYTSTGGRVHYKDYSGEVRADEMASVVSIGGVINIKKKINETFSVSYQMSIRYFYSSLRYSLLAQVGGSGTSEMLEFFSSSAGIEPAILPTWEILGTQFGLAVSYLVYFPTALKSENYSGRYLINRSRNKVRIDWSGFRIGVLLGYSF
jgi:hypothetical protein